MPRVVQCAPGFLLPARGRRGRGHVLRQQTQGSRQGVERQSMEAVVGVHRHAGVFDQEVLQRAGLQQDGLGAAAGEAGRGGDKPALLQRAGVHSQEAVLVLGFRAAVRVRVSRGVEGGA